MTDGLIATISDGANTVNGTGISSKNISPIIANIVTKNRIFLIDPKNLNVSANKFEDLLGNNAHFNAVKMIDIFRGEDNDFSKAVCLNAAAGLIVSEKYLDFKNAYETLRSHILSGKTFNHLQKIQNG